MTPEQREKLLGQDLTKTIDEINAVVRRRVPKSWAEDVDLLFVLFGNFWAHTLGQATVMAAGAVRAVDQKVEALAVEVEMLKERAAGDGSA